VIEEALKTALGGKRRERHARRLRRKQEVLRWLVTGSEPVS